MSSIETQAAKMVDRARNGFINAEDLLIEAALRIATPDEVINYGVDVSPWFAAMFLVEKGITFATVCRMAS